MDLKFLFFLFLIIWKVSADCVINISEQTATSTSNCSITEESDLEIEANKDVQVLQFESQIKKIEFLPPEIFQKLLNLEKVSAGKVGLQDLKMDNFEQAKSLKIIYIEENELTELRDYVFGGADKLEKIKAHTV
jgi:hypothetical protein